MMSYEESATHGEFSYSQLEGWSMPFQLHYRYGRTSARVLLGALFEVACNDSVPFKSSKITQFAVALNCFWITDACENLMKALGSVSKALMYEQTQ